MGKRELQKLITPLIVETPEGKVVPKASVKPEVKITVSIVSAPVTPHMKRCWKLFWNRLISECKREVKAGE